MRHVRRGSHNARGQHSFNAAPSRWRRCAHNAQQPTHVFCNAAVPRMPAPTPLAMTGKPHSTQHQSGPTRSRCARHSVVPRSHTLRRRPLATFLFCFQSEIAALLRVLLRALLKGWSPLGDHLSKLINLIIFDPLWVYGASVASQVSAPLGP